MDNQKFKACLRPQGQNAWPHDQVIALTGHAIGGVCPFAVPESARVYTDVSLKRFHHRFPRLRQQQFCHCPTCEELEAYARSLGWVDVCKNWDPALTD